MFMFLFSVIYIYIRKLMLSNRIYEGNEKVKDVFLYIFIQFYSYIRRIKSHSSSSGKRLENIRLLLQSLVSTNTDYNPLSASILV